MVDDPDNIDNTVAYWLGELKRYEKEYGPWEDRCARIIKRYRDERQRPDGQVTLPARFNSLWSNVQTLSPAIYAKKPKPVVERRFLDKDPLARYSSMTLERATSVQMEVGYFHPSTQQAVLDYLLCGRGVLWERYEPTYGEDEKGPDVSENDTDPKEPKSVTYEKVCTDYVYWKDFRHSPVRFWDEVTWVSKRSWLTRKEGKKRFGEKFKNVPLVQPDKVDEGRVAAYDGTMDRTPKACVWEIWDKTKREVIFIAPDYQTEVLEISKDPLKLQEFWPCPKPLYATVTNDTLVPIPDYVEYQDQADELDNLTARITALTTAVKVAGCYDASIPALQRILQEGTDNKLIAVDDWAAFSQKGGIPGAISLIPLKDIVEALIRLYDSRDRVKADLAEITGLSDIVRGQAQGNQATATEQRIKGQFATLRLQDRQAEVARFCKDSIAIKAEIISEQFSPHLLAEMTGILSHIEDDLPDVPMMGHNGGPPMNSGGPPATSPQGIPAGAPPPPNQAMIAQQRQQLAKGIFDKAIELLRNDKMRTFRIDIETNSTIELDRQEEKKSVVELFTAIGGFLEKATMIGMQLPELVPALGQSILFAFRRFEVGRDIEGMWENAIDGLEKKAKNPQPKPPSPDEIKANAEIQKANLAMQAQQQKTAGEQQLMQQQAQIKQQEMAMEAEKNKSDFALEQQRSAMEMQRLAEERAWEERKHQMEMEKLALEAEATRHNAMVGAMATQHKHELGIEVMEAKAEQAKKPKQ